MFSSPLISACLKFSRGILNIYTGFDSVSFLLVAGKKSDLSMRHDSHVDDSESIKQCPITANQNCM